MPNTYKAVFKKQRKLLENAPTEARNFAGIYFSELVVPRTPVDTGLARANWRIDIDEAIPQSRIDYDPNATKTPRRLRAEIKAAPKQGKLIISNWLAYIGKLEHGSSRQAPSGFLILTSYDVARYAPIFLKYAITGRSSGTPIAP
jgi:hypothetical protein